MTSLWFAFYLLLHILKSDTILLPVNAGSRVSIAELKLTSIGKFGLVRKARPNVPTHFHSGIDIQRPNNNYDSEPIYPIFRGKVISKRVDGPFAQLILEHRFNGNTFWTVYEHIAAINVSVGDELTEQVPIARFMNKKELDTYGWQFDHFHFEILRLRPAPISPDRKKPERLFNSYSLACHSPEDLQMYFYNPKEFMEKNLPR
jgi:murein DD-endopeptidase MepM/ murein hydrolase activator NlpD